MNYKFKVGDKVQLKQHTVIYSLDTYAKWQTRLGVVYTVVDIDLFQQTDIKLNSDYWVDARDMVLSYSEMLKLVLE